jgi:hypothetical protein
MLILDSMQRRDFLKSMGATALIPAIPLPAAALSTSVAPAVAAPFTAHTYQWAEMIVRAHNSCNLGLLQRSLRIDAGAAASLKQALIKNGIVTANANAYGIHKAVKPLYEGAFVSTSDTISKVKDVAEKVSHHLSKDEEAKEEIDSDFSDLEEETESTSELKEDEASPEIQSPDPA